MRISVRAWGGALLVAVLTGGLVGGSADAVGGGATVADGEFPFVAKVSFADQRACTGALVATRWIITAKSCFADGSAPVAAGAPARPTTVLLGRPDLTRTAGHRLSVVSVTPHPDRNIALAQLSGPVKDINPISLSSEAPQAGETLRIAGFGRTASEWVPNRLHAGTFTVESTTATSIAVQGAALCKGDAGSPAFRVVGGRAELVGTSDTSWQSGCLGETETRSGAVEARTDDLVGWIRAGTALKPDRLRDPVIGEFNGDSFPDLLAPDEAGRLWLYPGTANPELWGDRVQVGSGWTGYRELVVGKMNRDQYDDLAAIEQATGKLWLYPGNAAGAPFATKTEIGAGWGTFRDLTIGRVNRDQYDDLLAVNDTNSQLILYT
ncbi:S1 family peptidase, partial [Jidongwangia harbinensis]|uniref:S1 family peptidase n=1 Tax=Jidongwangia harbinensis TaxID=2878561 RepID=UPI001CD9CDB0